MVRRIAAVTKTKSGILLPEASVRSNEGMVISTGPGKLHESTGKHLPMQVKKGDKVMLPEYGGSNIKLDNEEFAIFKEHELQGIIKE